MSDPRAPSAASSVFPGIVAAACVLHVALVAMAGPGFMSSDDEVYTRLAHDMSVGAFELIPEHRGNRLGLIAPTAAAYAAFGVGLWTTVLWPLLWSCVGTVLVALVGRRMAGDRAGVLAAFLFAPLTIMVNGSAFLIPDGPVGVQMFAAAASMWVARESTGRRAAAWGALSALLVVIGVLTKLTTLWMAPFFLVLFVRDIVKRRNAGAWIAFATTGALGAAVFFGCYALATGDALYRVHAVSEKHNDTHWAYEDAGAAALLARITYQPALMLARALPELTLLTALGLTALTVVRSDRPRRRRNVLLWAMYAAVVVGGFWVGTTSFARLAPLPLLPRMLGPGAAPLAVLAAVLLVADRPALARLAPLVLVLVGAAVVVAVDGRLLVAGLYVAGAVTSLAALAGRGRLRTVATVGVVLLPVAMCGYSVARGGAGESRAMQVERALVGRLASETGGNALLLTDRRSERTVRFYRGYRDAPPDVRAWDDLPSAPEHDGPTFVYWHPARIGWRDGRSAPPDWLAAAVEHGTEVWKSKDARLVRLAP